MRIVGVSHVLDEADIIEPFIRHHAPLLDLHIVLDNGSTDPTVDILRALHAEGLKLQLYQSVSPIFLEDVYNTGLYRLALGEAADWVLFLDADELLVTCGADRPHASLALAPPDVACLRLPVFRYALTDRANPAHPFTRLTRREAQPHMNKIAARRIDPNRITIAPGCHFAYVDGAGDLGLSQDRLALAHVPDRNPLQVARKTILARLKATATGKAHADLFSTHLTEHFEALKRNPLQWLAEAETETPGDAVEDPVAYRGGPLRYTAPPDELGRLLSLLAAQTERLAKSHGAILDRKRLIRRDLIQEAGKTTRLL